MNVNQMVRDTEGFRSGTPSWLAAANAAEDAAICSGEHCPQCGSRGLAYRPFHREHVAYRAFAVCLVCDWCEEI